MNTLFGPVIYTYTRAQAIEDGQLIDISKTAKECGIKYPTAVTSRVWNYMIDNESEKDNRQIDLKTWDVCSMLYYAIKFSNTSANSLLYTMVRISDGEETDVRLKAVCGPGDNLEPVFTIMMSDED